MNQNDLYIEYARIIKMCKGTALENKPWLGVKCKGVVIKRCHPVFTAQPDSYEFAVAILEDRPVFVGDTLYHLSGAKQIVGNTDNLTEMTWQPPKPNRRIVLEEMHEENKKYRTGVFAPQFINGGIVLHGRNKIWRIIEDAGNQP